MIYFYSLSTLYISQVFQCMKNKMHLNPYFYRQTPEYTTESDAIIRSAGKYLVWLEAILLLLLRPRPGRPSLDRTTLFSELPCSHEPVFAAGEDRLALNWQIGQ